VRACVRACVHACMHICMYVCVYSLRAVCEYGGCKDVDMRMYLSACHHHELNMITYK